MDIQRVLNSLFLIWRSQGSLINSIPLVLDLKFWDLKMITIQYRDIQSALDVFQKYRFCEDYTNLFWTQMFLLEFLETNLDEFWTYTLPKLASFCNADVLSWYVILRALLCIQFIFLLRLVLWNIQINGQ